MYMVLIAIIGVPMGAYSLEQSGFLFLTLRPLKRLRIAILGIRITYIIMIKSSRG